MTSPNFTPGHGRLATDRYDFQKHLDGYTSFRHTAPQVDLSPSITVNGVPKSTVQTCLEAINALVPQIIPNATTSTVGLIQISGDINGLGSSATNVKVGGLQGRPLSTLAPSANDTLGWDGYVWKPTTASSSPTFSSLYVTGSTTLSGGVTITGGAISLNTTSAIGITTLDTCNIVALNNLLLSSIHNIQLSASGGSSTMSLAATNGITFSSVSTFSQNVSLNGSLTTIGDSLSDVLTINSVSEFNNDITFRGSDNVFKGTITPNGPSARILNNGIVANDANQAFNIRQYKYIIIPSTTTGPHTYTLTNTSTVDGDWFKISNLTAFTHTLAGAVAGSIAPSSFLEYSKTGGLWYPVGF